MTSERAISETSGGFRFRPSKRAARLDGGGDPLPLELGARIELLEQLWVLTHLATCTERVASSRAGLADMPDCYRCSSGLNETAEHTFYHYERVRLFWDHVGDVNGSHQNPEACAARRWLRRRRFTSVSEWEVCGVSRDPSCSLNGDLVDAKEGIVWRCKLFASWSRIVF